VKLGFLLTQTRIEMFTIIGSKHTYGGKTYVLVVSPFTCNPCAFRDDPDGCNGAAPCSRKVGTTYVERGVWVETEPPPTQTRIEVFTIFTNEPFEFKGKTFLLVPAMNDDEGCSTCALKGDDEGCASSPFCATFDGPEVRERGYFKEIES
jgi:hypothetical protein